MAQTARVPLLPLLADNDNGAPDRASGDPRARAALLAPLRRVGAAPPPACRRFHTIRGERVLASIVAVEWLDDGPRWRVSVCIQGRLTEERRNVALLLAQHVALAHGQGQLDVVVGPSTVFVRRALTAAERALLVQTRLAVAHTGLAP